MRRTILLVTILPLGLSCLWPSPVGVRLRHTDYVDGSCGHRPCHLQHRRLALRVVDTAGGVVQTVVEFSSNRESWFDHQQETDDRGVVTLFPAPPFPIHVWHRRDDGGLGLLDTVTAPFDRNEGTLELRLPR